MTTATQLAKEAEKRKEEIESDRKIPDDLIVRVKNAGLVRLWTAKKYQGAEVSISSVSQVIRSMSYHNGSLAWVIGITNCSSLFSGYLPEEKARGIYSNEKAMIGGFAGPAGIAHVDGDGLVVSGTWSWGSGISHCSHIVGGVRIMDGDDFRSTGIVFFNPSEVILKDNWHVLGLRGSHSIDYGAKDVRIPNDRWSYFPLRDGLVDAPIYRFSFLGALSISVASVGLGLARRALDEIMDLAKVKSPFGQGKPLSGRTIFQQELAKIYGDYMAAETLLDQTIHSVQLEVSTTTCSNKSKGDIRLASCHATQLCSNVVHTAYRLAGGSSIWKTAKLEELLRDMNVVSQHGMVAQGNYRTVGSLLLGNQVPEQLL